MYFISTYYFGYDWIITIMGYRKHELSTINMLYSLRKNCNITPVQSPKWSRPRNDPQPWNDPQIDPEMIPISLHVDLEMIPI